MARYEGSRERTAVTMSDVLCSEGRAPALVGRLFAGEKAKGIDRDGKEFSQQTFLEPTAWGGCSSLSSDATVRIGKLALEIRTPDALDRGVLRTDIKLLLVIGAKLYNLLPPIADKDVGDGVARYDFYADIDGDTKAWMERANKEWLEKTGMWSQNSSRETMCYATVAARQGFWVHYEMTEAARAICAKKDTFVRVSVVGETTRDVE